MSKNLVCNFSIRKGNRVFDHRYMFSWLLFQHKSSTIIISSFWCRISRQMLRQPAYIIEYSIRSRALNFQKALRRYTQFFGLIFFNEVTQLVSPICQLAYVAKSSQEKSSNLHCQNIYTHLLLINSQRLHIQLKVWISENRTTYISSFFSPLWTLGFAT